jgi:hypothetical protein
LISAVPASLASAFSSCFGGFAIRPDAAHVAAGLAEGAPGARGPGADDPGGRRRRGRAASARRPPGRREAWRRDPQDARARNVKVTWTVLPMRFKNDE